MIFLEGCQEILSKISVDDIGCPGSANHEISHWSYLYMKWIVGPTEGGHNIRTYNEGRSPILGCRACCQRMSKMKS